MSKTIQKSLIILMSLGLAGAGIYYYLQSKKPGPESLYRLQEITQGDVEQTVNANGTINPVSLINVGTQVSGRVKKLYVDFNDKVKEGQVLLELDDSLFTEQIAQSEGNVRNIQASLELAQANEARTRSLFSQEYVSKLELDQAVQALKSARAQLDTARAQLNRDKTNLDYSIIRSPVSGVVVDRVVDIGQTVAASFQTPTLITIAQDLSKMQINSSFAEADIGNIKEGQKARFSVDAFPNRNFEGVVKQLRLNPTTTSNVVTYNVVVSVDNPEQILLPGMTAYVNIAVANHSNVLLAPNAALRYKPKLDETNAAAVAPKEKPVRSKKWGSRDDMAAGKVYVIRNGTPTQIKVRSGISDGHFTEIRSKDLKAGDKVIVGETQADNQTAGAGSSMRMRMF